jgi:hypothetical protein
MVRELVKCEYTSGENVHAQPSKGAGPRILSVAPRPRGLESRSVNSADSALVVFGGPGFFGAGFLAKLIVV